MLIGFWGRVQQGSLLTACASDLCPAAYRCTQDLFEGSWVTGGRGSGSGAGFSRVVMPACRLQVLFESILQQPANTIGGKEISPRKTNSEPHAGPPHADAHKQTHTSCLPATMQEHITSAHPAISVIALIP